VITLDASVVIAHLNPADANHQAATGYLQDSAGEEFRIHSLNLAEVLTGGVREGRGHEMMADLAAIGISVADRQDGEAMRMAELRVSSKLKLPDCCALDVALTTGSTLATFDDALADAARRRQIIVAPETASGPPDPSIAEEVPEPEASADQES
jgi:predicted nucleic acid-binding protein